MATYLILNLIVMSLVVVSLYVLKALKIDWRTLAIMLLMTLIFDSLIVISGIVAYDTMKILGIYIGFAPIEDFFYTLIAVMLVPALWIMLGKKNAK